MSNAVHAAQWVVSVLDIGLPGERSADGIRQMVPVETRVKDRSGVRARPTDPFRASLDLWAPGRHPTRMAPLTPRPSARPPRPGDRDATTPAQRDSFGSGDLGPHKVFGGHIASAGVDPSRHITDIRAAPPAPRRHRPQAGPPVRGCSCRRRRANSSSRPAPVPSTRPLRPQPPPRHAALRRATCPRTPRRSGP